MKERRAASINVGGRRSECEVEIEVGRGDLEVKRDSGRRAILEGCDAARY